MRLNLTGSSFRDTPSTLTESCDCLVGTIWGANGQHCHLLDVMRGRWKSPELRQRMIAVADDYQVDATLIEHAELGPLDVTV